MLTFPGIRPPDTNTRSPAACFQELHQSKQPAVLVVPGRRLGKASVASPTKIGKPLGCDLLNVALKVGGVAVEFTEFTVTSS